MLSRNFRLFITSVDLKISKMAVLKNLLFIFILIGPCIANEACVRCFAGFSQCLNKSFVCIPYNLKVRASFPTMMKNLEKVSSTVSSTTSTTTTTEMMSTKASTIFNTVTCDPTLQNRNRKLENKIARLESEKLKVEQHLNNSLIENSVVKQELQEL